ncbi:MAG TPA: Bax inhibitor-1/YccA family protein [Bacteroidetes bacterium]|nr:Bax inhibitor-1/YccA family protein [Bacteroidota bacterium]
MERRGTGNPVLSEKFFTRAANYTGDNVMTIGGTMNKTILLFLLLLLAAAYVWKQVMAGIPGAFGYMTAGFVVGFILALVTTFKVQWSPYTAPLYAVMEGLALGGLSAIFEVQYPGLVMRAVVLTFGTFFMILFLYRSRIVKPTQRFVMGIVAATGGIMIVYLVGWIASLFGASVSLLYGNSTLSIGFSLFVVVIAALNLILDFSFIEQMSKTGAPKFMEWYAGFGLIVTLVWLYIEILRLLVKLAANRE